MNNLYRNTLVIALTIITMTVANAADDTGGAPIDEELLQKYPNKAAAGGEITLLTTNTFDVFSHTVLTLPGDPRNEESWSQVISSQDEWESFFYAQTAHITYLQGQSPIAGEFDFEKYQILTGGLGVRSSGGHSLVVEGVFELDNVIDIQVLEVRPDTQCIVPMAISYPSATVLVKKTDKPFQFTVTQLVNECLD